MYAVSSFFESICKVHMGFHCSIMLMGNSNALAFITRRLIG